MSKLSLFEGYQKKSKRYQTRRSEEIQQRDKNAYKQLLELEKTINSPGNMSDVELVILEKRYNSLKRLFKVANTRDLTQVFVPFRIDARTVVYIREKNCLKPKWVKKLGRKFIEGRIKDFKKKLHAKPKEIIYWNPYY